MLCMRYSELIAALQHHKDSGDWERISKLAGLDYSTLARIARGVISNPGVLTCERIWAAIGQIERTQPAHKEPAHG